MSGRRSSLTPEERAQRALKAKRKFRAIVRLIIANLSWLQEIEDEQLGDNVQRNIAVLTRKKGKKGLLTLRDKAVLNKPQELRTEEEKTHLKRLIGNLKCFRRYPPEIKNELPGVMYFCYFDENRIIVKQGYEPINMYVILSGEVVVSITYYDKLLKEQVTKNINLMGPGSYFGEVSLLHGIRRTATVTTTQPSEFLYIKQEDFDRVLKSTVASQWAKIQESMSHFRYFRGWSELEIRESCILAKLKNFEADQIIVSSTGGELDFAYFVIKGSCYLVEYMKIKTVYKKGLPHYYLVDEKEEDRQTIAALKKEIKKLHVKPEGSTGAIKQALRPLISTSNVIWKKKSEERVHFIKVCSFKTLACFNIGESLKNRVIVASEDTECLLLPRYFLLEKSMITARTVEHFLTHHIPSTQRIFELCLEEKKWTKYKQRLVDSILLHKSSVSGNNIHNVPYSIRLTEDLGEI